MDAIPRRIPLLPNLGRVVVEPPVLRGFPWVGEHGVQVAVHDQPDENMDEDQVDNREGDSEPRGPHGRVGEVEVDDPAEVEEEEEDQDQNREDDSQCSLA